MDEEAWQAVGSHAAARRVYQKASRFLPRAWLKTFFSQWRHAMRPAVEERRLELWRDLEGLARLNLQIAWCRYRMEALAKAASYANWKAKQRWLEGQTDSMACMQVTGDWTATGSTVRKLIGRRKRAFRPAPMLGDDGKPLASLQANQHQRKLMRSSGRIAPNSASRNIMPRYVRTSKRPQSSSSGGRRTRAHCQVRSVSGRMLFAFSPSPSQVVLAGLTRFLRS